MSKRALVVDDNANNLMLEKDLLEVAGFEVFEAENAADGIAIARREKPDIIIMDPRPISPRQISPPLREPKIS